MPATTLLRDLVVLVGIAIPVVALAHRLRVPSIVGFLVAGIVIGPHALGLVRDLGSVNALADMGIVLLLFAIGLELSLDRVMRLGRVLLQGGSLQVGGTIAAVATVAMALGAGVPRALVYGALAAMSSTAILLKVYADRGALDSPDARIVIPISLFQDLCIIPFVLLVGLAGGSVAGGAWQAALRIGVSVAVLAALVLGGRVAVPWVLARVARLRSRELFTLSIVFLGAAAAFVTQSVGLSLALGGFIAGLVISESEYGLQALSDVVPFRDTLTGIFFASVGMLLDPRLVAAQPVLVFGAAAGLLLLKATVATGAALSLRRPLRVSIVAGLALAPIGEFAFVLAAIARPVGLLSPDAYQLFLAASLLTMLAAPFIMQAAPSLAAAVGRLARQPAAPAAEVQAEIDALRDHVIIVGYGVNGRNLARVLDGAGIPYVILEQNGQTVEQAREELQPIFFGDATRPEVLERAGIRRARALVFAIASPADELRGVAVARGLSDTVHIVVRTRYVRGMEDLRRAGANQVVPEEFETSLEIFSRVLRHYEVPSNLIAREVDAARVELYGMALGRAAGPSQLEALARLGVHHALEIVEVEPEARAVGSHPVTLHLRHETGANVVAVVRDGQVISTPDAAFRFGVGDVVLLAGADEALARGRAVFLGPPPPPL